MKFIKEINEVDFINNELIIPFSEHNIEHPQAFVYMINEDGNNKLVVLDQSFNNNYDLKLSVGRAITGMIVIQ